MHLKAAEGYEKEYMEGQDPDYVDYAKYAAEQSELERKIYGLNRFIGSLSEYNSLMGEHIIIDIRRPHKFVYVDDQGRGYQRRETALLQNSLTKKVVLDWLDMFH